VEQSVDGGWRIAGAATGNVGQWNAVVGEVRRCLIPETRVDVQACTALAEGCPASAVHREGRGYRSGFGVNTKQSTK